MAYIMTKEAFEEALRDSGLWEKGGAGREALREELINSHGRFPTCQHPTGKPLGMEDFEADTMPMRVDGSVGYDVHRTTSPPYVFRGNGSLFMSTPGGALYQTAIAAKFFGPPSSKRIGVELWFELPLDQPQIFEVAMEYYDGTTFHATSIQWINDPAYNLFGWRYWNEAGRWADIDGAAMNLARGMFFTWHNMKWIIDYDTGRYVTLFCDDQEFDLSGYTYQKTATVTVPYLIISPSLWCQSTTAVHSCIDDLMVTTEEP